MSTLHLIDGSSYFYRAYHAHPRWTSPSGEPTGALFGVVLMLKRWLQSEQPEHIAFVFDASGGSFRNQLYPEYKAHRPPMPDELRAQIEPLLELVRALGVPVLRVSGVEADDVIGTLARQGEAAGMQVLISTSDKDLTQLVSASITWINTMSDERLDPAGVAKKFGVRPDQIRDFLALMGDKVDNIPGVPKCGEVTAAKWLREYHSLEGVLANADAIAGKIGENLRAARAQLPLAQRLTTVKTDCELPVTPNDLHRGPPDLIPLRALYQRFDFRQFLLELDGADAKPSASPRLVRAQTGTGFVPPAVPDCVSQAEKHYECITTEAQLEHWLAQLRKASLICLDTETDALDAQQAGLVGLSFAIEPGRACYIPLAHRDLAGLLPQLNMQSVLDRLRPVLEDPAIAKLGQHGKYDMHVLRRHGIQVQGYQHDAMLVSYVLNATFTQHNMDAMAAKYLGRKTITFAEVAGKGAKQLSFAEVPIVSAAEYAAEDADVTLSLFQTLYPALSAEPTLLAIYREIEIPLVPVLARMEAVGIRLDVEELRRQSLFLGHEMQRLVSEAHALAGHSFSLDSPKQLQSLLFDTLKLPVKVKTPSGQASTNEEALEALVDQHPLPQLILDYRGVAKLKSTYTDKLGLMVDQAQRVHTSFHQAVAATGRLSSSDPNLQNIPIRSEYGRRIRRAFVAPPGWVLVAADYSQIELRIMAHLSGDTAMLDAFARGVDIHRATAAEVIGIAAEAVNQDQRRAAKAINFGLIYGMGEFGLARNLGIGRIQARDYIKRYFERFPGVERYMQDTRKRAHEQGYVETLFGRRLYLPDLQARQRTTVAAAERAAINAPMQGTAADIIKRAMLTLDQWLLGREAEIRMLLQVHDELVFEVRADCIESYREGIIARMRGAAELKVPLDVELGVGNNWGEAH